MNAVRGKDTNQRVRTRESKLFQRQGGVLVVVATLVFAMFAGLAPVEAEEYQRLTPEQARLWMDFAPESEVVDVVIEYDYIEHSEPIVEAPKWAAVVVGRDVHMTQIGSITVTAGKLSWSVTFDPATFVGLLPEPESWTAKLKWAAGGAVVGALVAIPLTVLALKAILAP
ncbi:MAG: hypothetical protein WC683_04045 [bacterium]